MPDVYYVLKEKSEAALGIYPQAIIENGIETKRTEWQEGWNACLKAMLSNYITVKDWYESHEKKEYLKLLLEDEVLELDVENKKVICFVNLNDTFCYAADAEDLEEKDIEQFYDIYCKYGYDGVIAFFSHKRNIIPIKGLYDGEQFVKAMKELKEKK